MSGELCIFGEVLFDCFPDGREVLGGAPFNVAWHLQAFGQSPVFISRVGVDAAGRRVRDAMSEWGMALDGLQSDASQRTGRVEVSLEDGEPSYEIVANSAFDAIAADALPPVAPSLIYHGSLAVRSPMSSAALRVLKSQTNASVFIDVNLRAPWWSADEVIDLVDDADWVKLNRDELRLLHGEIDDLYSAADRFRSAHALTGVVLTLGGDGAMVVVADQAPLKIAPKPVDQVVDAVGAGDGFAAIFLLGSRLGWPLPTVLERAQSFASEMVQRRGATVSDRSFYQSFSTEWALTD